MEDVGWWRRSKVRSLCRWELSPKNIGDALEAEVVIVLTLSRRGFGLVMLDRSPVKRQSFKKLGNI